jgi:catechol 2,3-dioxygenase-like lactoylglutathione lyase family enzyme
MMPAITTSNVTVMVKDLDRSIEFYTKVLGLSLVNRWGNHYAQVSAPGITIGLHPNVEEFTNRAGMSIGFGIEDIESAKRLLDEKGVKSYSKEDKSGILLSFMDPDGTPLYFMQSKVGPW